MLLKNLYMIILNLISSLVRDNLILINALLVLSNVLEWTIAIKMEYVKKVSVFVIKVILVKIVQFNITKLIRH
jgi:hypothetical protein